MWFHDAVYTPGSSTNEAESAELAAQLLLPAGLPADTVARVQKYIRATADHHHLEGDPDGDLFMDADMAVLVRAARSGVACICGGHAAAARSSA